MERLDGDYVVGEVLPQGDIEALAKLYYRLGGVALEPVLIDRLLDNPNIILGEE